MVEYLVFLYISGAMITTGLGVHECHEHPNRVTTVGECSAIATVGGLLWPVIVGTVIAEKVKN